MQMYIEGPPVRAPFTPLPLVLFPLTNFSNYLYMPSHPLTETAALSTFVIIMIHERMSSGELGSELRLKEKKERERKEKLTVNLWQTFKNPIFFKRRKPLEEEPEEDRRDEVSFHQTEVDGRPNKSSQMAAPRAVRCPS